MKLFKHTLNIKFTNFFKKSLSISLIICFVSSIIIFTKGLTESIDFAGGTTINITFTDSIDITQCRKDLNSYLNQNVEVVLLNNSDDILSQSNILLKMPFGDYAESIKNIFNTNYPSYIINQETSIGPKIGNELKAMII